MTIAHSTSSILRILTLIPIPCFHMTTWFPMLPRNLKQAETSLHKLSLLIRTPPALNSLPSLLLPWNLDDIPFYPRKQLCPLSLAPSTLSDNFYQHTAICHVKKSFLTLFLHQHWLFFSPSIYRKFLWVIHNHYFPVISLHSLLKPLRSDFCPHYHKKFCFFFPGFFLFLSFGAQYDVSSYCLTFCFLFSLIW